MQREFIETLKDLRGGALPGELGAELQRVVAAVRATGKSGALVLTLDIAPLKQAGENTVIVTDTLRVKVPEPLKPTTILYADDDNTLTRKDPRQPELTGLRTVPGTVTPIRRAEELERADG